MFNVSKKSVLLPIIFFTASHTQCSENLQNLQNLQITGGTITISSDNSRQRNSPYWELGKFLAPFVITSGMNYLLQKYKEDPEIKAINKKEKKIELAIKQHPDYINIEIQHKKNEFEKETLTIKEKKVELNVMHANLIKHHQDEWARFRKCEVPFTRDFCDHMVNLHQINLNQLMELSNARS
jgi:hypothetical protein